MANILWAFATLDVQPGEQLLQAGVQRMYDLLPQTKPQALSNTMWAFATLGHNPGELPKALLVQVLALLATHLFSPRLAYDCSCMYCDQMHVWQHWNAGDPPGLHTMNARATHILRNFCQRPLSASACCCKLGHNEISA